MKFRCLNIDNVKWSLPTWAFNVSMARELDGNLRKYKVPRDVTGTLGFWVELDYIVGTLRIAEPDDGVNFCGRMIVKGRGYQIEVPLNPMLKGYPDAITGMHSVYMHAIQTEVPLAYIGITKRHWSERLGEHESAAARGSPYIFHDALRRHSDVSILHRVSLNGLDNARALEIEEEFVAGLTLYPMGLNMIPGGLAGLRYLAQQGFNRTTSETRDTDIAELMARPSIAGRPNPLCSARWGSDPDYAARVICGHSGRLTVEQLSQLRILAVLGRSPEDIATTVGAKSLSQVLRAMSGATYGRVH